jgi:minichromosome maintenance protein 10
MRCIREKHKVKRKREIKKQENTAQKRMNLKNRSVDDGGLVLGAGLEWSSW